MAAGGNIGKLVLIGALGFGAWYVYDTYYAPPGAMQEADRAMLAGRYREAADLYEQAAWEDPDNVRVQLKLGECYFHLGQKAQAAAHYRKVESAFGGSTGSVDMRRHQERYETLRAEGF